METESPVRKQNSENKKAGTGRTCNRSHHVREHCSDVDSSRINVETAAGIGTQHGPSVIEIKEIKHKLLLVSEIRNNRKETTTTTTIEPFLAYS